jgi:pimeloyl-ACP methyl ester carboxylesterase
MNAAAAPARVRTGTAAGVYYEVHGDGAPLFLGFPLMASYAAIFGTAAARVRHDFLAGLADRYRVLLVDYPSIGASATVPPHEFTLERACADLLAVADDAGFERFAWWGGTFGAVVGLALAARTDRVAALVCAGWSPLGTPYADMVRGARSYGDDPPPHARVILRTPGQYAQWSAFYGSVPGDWDRAVVPRIQCPRLVVYGADTESSVGDVSLPIAATLRARRAELVSLGWQMREVAGQGAGLILDAAALVPAVRPFLDSVPFDSNSVQGANR